MSSVTTVPTNTTNTNNPQELLTQFEQACNNLGHPQFRVESEKFLQSIEASNQPYEFCTMALEKCSSQLHRFHAANILRKAVMREWLILSEQVKLKLTVYIIQYVMNQGYVL